MIIEVPRRGKHTSTVKFHPLKKRGLGRKKGAAGGAFGLKSSNNGAR